MKILMTAHDFYPNIGGVSTVVGLLAESFVRSGHEVRVATLASGPPHEYGYEVVRNPGPGALSRMYRQADVVILSNLALKLIYPLLWNRRGVALQHHSESAFRLSRSWFSADLLRRSVMSRATHFMCSEFVGRKSGLSDYRVASPPVAALTGSTIIADMSERRHALFVGRTVQEKGVLWLVERWPLLRDELGVEQLRIVGSGPLDAMLAQHAAHYPGIRQMGRLSPLETAEQMARARYLLVPSLWEEPFGAVALEGIEAGALTVLSSRGGLPEAGGDLAFYYDSDDDDSFIHALRSARVTFERFVANPSLAAAWGERAQIHLARFRADVIAAQILERAALACRTTTRN